MSTVSANGSLNLTKGERVDLTKTNPGLKIAAIGLGWDANAGTSSAFDLDAFAIGLSGGKVAKPLPESVLYFGSPKVAGKLAILNEGLVHSGDNLTGVGSGDDETILVDFSKLPSNVDEVLICVNVYDAASRRQNFGMVNNAFIRAYDFETKNEILKFDLTEDYSSFSGMIMGKLYMKDGEWKFQAVGQGANGDINQIAGQYC